MTQTCTIHELPRARNQLISNNYQIKRFSTRDKAESFIQKENDRDPWGEPKWKILEGQNLPSGVYFGQRHNGSTKYINTKTLAI